MAQDIPPPTSPGGLPEGEPGSEPADHPVGRGGRRVRGGAEALRGGPPPTALPGRAPFAWQHGNRLLLLEARPLGWIMAELRFDPGRCHYVEIRRTRYRWAREAAGALLSRALAAGDTAPERAARDLDAWLIRQ